MPAVLPWPVRYCRLPRHRRKHPRGPGRSPSSSCGWPAASRITNRSTRSPTRQEIRGTLTTIQTTLPGVRFTEVMPRHGEADRQDRARPHVRRRQRRSLPGAGLRALRPDGEPAADRHRAEHRARSSRSCTARAAGFPGYIAVPGTTRPGPPPKNLFVGGWLGRQYGPFLTGGKAKNEDFTAGVKEDVPEEEFTKQARAAGRRAGRGRLAGRRSLPRETRPRPEALGAGVRRWRTSFAARSTCCCRRRCGPRSTWVSEADKIRERYGKTKIGTRCLLARRLVEAGAPFVMVDYGYDPEYGNLWDQHNAPGQNFPHICEMAKRPYHLAGVDRAFAALLEDLAVRGRLGRNARRVPHRVRPHAEDQQGRRPRPLGPHRFASSSPAAACTAVRSSAPTDSRGADPVTPAYTPADTAATIYAALGIDLAAVLHDREGRSIPMLPVGQPIRGVL